jgi:hypothetical protein
MLGARCAVAPAVFADQQKAELAGDPVVGAVA